jgi:hypothetical protein
MEAPCPVRAADATHADADVAAIGVAVADGDVGSGAVDLVLVGEPGGAEVNAAVVALLERSREGLRAAASELDARSRWAGAHLAALRAATAVLAVRGRPGPARSRPRSVWQVLPRLAPELTEWAAFLGSLPRADGPTAEDRARAADDLLRDAELFLRAVTGALSLPWRPVLPDVVAASR